MSTLVIVFLCLCSFAGGYCVAQIVQIKKEIAKEKFDV